MFKVISAEFKKILSKPSIYILAIILAVILVLGVLIYNPTPQQSNIITLKGDTYTAKYDEFYKTSVGNKQTTTNKLNNSINSVNTYIVIENNQEYTRKEYIDLLYENVLTEFYEYRNYASYSSELTEQAKAQKIKLQNAINVLDTNINDSIQLALHNSFSMLTTTKNYEDYCAVIKEIKTWADVSPNQSTLSAHCNKFETNLKLKLETCLNSFIYPNISESFIKSYTSTEENTKLSIIYSRLQKIEEEISTIYNEINIKGDEENHKLAYKMDELANLYVNTADTYVNLVKYELISNAFSYTSTKQQLDLLHLKEYSNYNNQSLLIKYDYLFSNNKTEYDYSNPLTIGVTSNNEINAYDYAYFSIKLFSVVIIAYAIMLACNTIAGEVKEGSMRYFAIRPISRNEIYFGKLLSIIILSTILILFSAVISICVGGAVYGFTSLDILTIFNSSTAIVLKPLGMLAIFLVSLIIELTIYTSIALLLSSLIKSDVLAVTIILGLYLINTLLPLFVQGPNTWLSYYPFSHISLYTLFGSAVYAPNNFFNLLLGVRVYSTTGLSLILFVIIALISVINIIATKIFKYKEL